MTNNPRPSLKEIIERRQAACYNMVNSCIDEIVRMVTTRAETSALNNKLVDLRNGCVEFIRASLTEIVAFFEHKAAIEPAEKSSKQFPRRGFQDPCRICGERRISNLCHVIPRRAGGSDDSGNLIMLCPTHHFLLDHARLSRTEFQAIDASGLSDRAKAYLEGVHRKRHELRWRYHTNRFSGCDCGSVDFKFVPNCNGTYFTVALSCLQCGQTWLNLWEEGHPFHHAEGALPDAGGEMTPEERAQSMKEALERVQRFIDEAVPRLLQHLT